MQELLDADKIRQYIKMENLFQLSQIEIFEKLDSTNTYLLNKGKLGAPSGTVCFAEKQTAGRGRLNRVWHSPQSENIYCSLLWRFKKNLNSFSSLSIAIAVIVANTLENYGIKKDIQLKWPNDIFYRDRKLAGILIEQSHLSGLVIGIGINLGFPKDDKNVDKVHWTDLSNLKLPINRNYVAGLLLNELFENIPIYENEGLEPFIKDWKKKDALFGRSVLLSTPNKIIEGKMCGINSKGELLLECLNGKSESFSSGEVSVRLKSRE